MLESDPLDAQVDSGERETPTASPWRRFGARWLLLLGGAVVFAMYWQQRALSLDLTYEFSPVRAGLEVVEVEYTQQGGETFARVRFDLLHGGADRPTHRLEVRRGVIELDIALRYREPPPENLVGADHARRVGTGGWLVRDRRRIAVDSDLEFTVPFTR